MISVGPTKVHYTQHSPGANIFSFDASDQMLCANCRVLMDPVNKMATILLSSSAR